MSLKSIVNNTKLKEFIHLDKSILGKEDKVYETKLDLPYAAIIPFSIVRQTK